MKWSLGNIVGEALRLSGYANHVANPMPPRSIYGLHSSAWPERRREIEATAQLVTVPHSVGVGGKRRLRKDAPIMLMAVASYPGDPLAPPSPERDRWQVLVIEAAKARWGDRLRSAIAHVDESYYHVHMWIDDDGRPVKRLHSGHAAALEVASAGGTRAEQGTAYKRGCQQMLAWFHAAVGEPMGWRRESKSPAPRVPRAAVIARRLREAEAAELEAEKQGEALRIAAGEVAASGRRVQEQIEQSRQDREDLRATYADLKAERAELDTLRAAINDPEIEALIRVKQAAALANLRP